VRFTLHIDGKRLGDGTLLVNSEGQARFCAGDGEEGSLLLAVLEGAVLEGVASNGLAINGHELGGRRRAARRGWPMKVPYGISDFRQVIGEGYYFVDRSDHIHILEEMGKQLLFLRPPPLRQCRHALQFLIGQCQFLVHVRLLVLWRSRHEFHRVQFAQNVVHRRE
jgi:hypothetical protein